MNEITLNAGGLRLAAVASGNPADRPVLALHGWMDNAGSFDPLAPLLDDCYVVALELPGHGASASGGDYFGFLDNLTVIHQALADLGWQQCTLLGHSMGGGLAALYAALFPAAVQALISLDSYGPMSMAMTTHSLPDLLASAVRARDKHPEQRFFPSREAAVDARVNANFPRHCAEVLARRGVEQTASGWSWRGDRRLKWPSHIRLSEHQVTEMLATITSPHLVLLAEDALYPAAVTIIRQRLTDQPPTGCEKLPGGHHLHMQHPLLCADAIRRFLDEL